MLKFKPWTIFTFGIINLFFGVSEVFSDVYYSYYSFTPLKSVSFLTKPSEPENPYIKKIQLHYKNVVNKLKEYNFSGPFAEEVSRFALMRQLLEDGLNRDPLVSMVGIVPGSLGKRVASRLNIESKEGHSIKVIKANDGQGCYAISGPEANLLSCVAIALVWDEYVSGPENYLKDQDLKQAWRTSHALSSQISCDPKPDLYKEYADLGYQRGLVIRKCNSMYGPQGSSIVTLTEKLYPEFKKHLEK